MGGSAGTGGLAADAGFTFHRQQVVLRCLVDLLPCIQEAALLPGHAQMLQAVAGDDTAIPGDVEAASAATAAQPAGRLGRRVAVGRRRVSLAFDRLQVALEGLLQLEQPHVILGDQVAEAVAAAGVLAGRHEGGVHVELNPRGRRAPHQRFVGITQVLVGRDGEHQRQERLVRHPEVAHHPLKVPPTGHPLVGILALAIQGNLDGRRRMGLEKADARFVQQHAVGQDGHLNALTVQEQIQSVKVRRGHAFAAGERCVHHASVDGLLHDGFPGFSGQGGLAAELLLVQVNVTHPAVQVAQGCDLEGALERDAPLPGAHVDEVADRPLVEHAVRPVFLQKPYQMRQGFCILHQHHRFMLRQALITTFSIRLTIRAARLRTRR